MSSPNPSPWCIAFTRELASCASVADALAQISATAAARLDGAAAAGLTMLHGERFATVAGTTELPARVDEFQYEHGGPCLDALLDPTPALLVGDLRRETRWPEFAAAALAHTPVVSMLSYGLYLHPDDPLGSLNLYATEPQAFTDDTVRAGRSLAAHAALGLALVMAQEQAANLRQALQSSRDIGAAIGILMNRHLITREEAFDRLRTASQTRHRKLRELALDVAETGTLDVPANGQRPSRHNHKAGAEPS